MRSAGVRLPCYWAVKAQYIQRPIYHATMRYTYTLPMLAKAEEQVKVRLDNLGVRLDPSIIWNAIPFSFLIDWVIDVSAFLRSFARDNWPISTVVQEFCHSMTYSSNHVVQLLVYDQFSDPVDDITRGKQDPFNKQVSGAYGNLHVYSGYRSLYDRRVAMPLGDTHTIAARGIDLRKAALSASLIYSFSKGLNSQSYLRPTTSTKELIRRIKVRRGARK
jgi:hypothetical protein